MASQRQTGRPSPATTGQRNRVTFCDDAGHHQNGQAHGRQNNLTVVPDGATPMSAMSSATLILGHFANLKLAGDRAVRDAVQSMQAHESPVSTSSAMRSFFAANPTHSASGVRRRRRRGAVRTSRSSARVHAMTDADLEAELAARRSARARERDRYARAMRSEKLSLLEGELTRLRSEIARLDRHGVPGATVGGGTPPTSRWESLSSTARGRGTVPGQRPGAFASPSNAPPRGPPGAPPPPPPPMGRGGDDDAVIDPERQRREKEERQRRREQKRKEREAAKKPLTLADIIRGAGPNPAGRLKPSGSTSLPDIDAQEEEKAKEDIGALRDSLKKVEGNEEESRDGKENGKEGENGKSVVAGRKEPETAQKGKGKDLNSGKGEDQMDGADVNDRNAGDFDNGNAGDVDAESARDADATNDGDRHSSLPPVNGSGQESSSQPHNSKSSAEVRKGVSATAEEQPSGTAKPEEATVRSKDDIKESSTSPSSAEPTSETEEVKSEVTSIKDPTGNGDDRKDEVSQTGDKDAPEGKDLQNTAADAASALSALAASIPKVKASASAGSSRAERRMSLAEKRKLRRAAAAASVSKGQTGRDEKKADGSTDLADVLAAANALKID